jgi:hypothetical protein
VIARETEHNAAVEAIVTQRLFHHLRPGLEARGKGDGYGVYALRPFAKGELLLVWGGHACYCESVDELPERNRHLFLQVEENTYLIVDDGESADRVNHSCDPNAGLLGQITLIALRDIEPGEEICYDYAMSDGSTYDEFPCGCGAANCRGKVTGEDWRQPELQQRYRGNFSPYLQRRIDALARERETQAAIKARASGRVRFEPLS